MYDPVARRDVPLRVLQYRPHHDILLWRLHSACKSNVDMTPIHVKHSISIYRLFEFD